MRKFVLIAALVLLVGCASMDAMMSTRGVVDEHVSKMDEVRVVTMTPVIAGGDMAGHDAGAEFGFYWDSKKNHHALLVIQLNGAVNFDQAKPVEFKVDGERFSLPAARRSTGNIETIGTENRRNVTRKEFMISKDQILQIANAKETVYRVYLLGNKYMDGEVVYMHQDMQSFVPKSFRAFHAKVWGQE